MTGFPVFFFWKKKYSPDALCNATPPVPAMWITQDWCAPTQYLLLMQRPWHTVYMRVSQRDASSVARLIARAGVPLHGTCCASSSTGSAAGTTAAAQCAGCKRPICPMIKYLHFARLNAISRVMNNWILVWVHLLTRVNDNRRGVLNNIGKFALHCALHT